jgi:hypothetical protein
VLEYIHYSDFGKSALSNRFVEECVYDGLAMIYEQYFILRLFPVILRVFLLINIAAVADDSVDFTFMSSSVS